MEKHGRQEKRDQMEVTYALALRGQQCMRVLD